MRTDTHGRRQSCSLSLLTLTQPSDKSQRKWQPPSICSGLSREVRRRRLSRGTPNCAGYTSDNNFIVRESKRKTELAQTGIRGQGDALLWDKL